MKFFPEGARAYPRTFTTEQLLDAMYNETLLESLALAYDNAGQLHFNLGAHEGIMPHEFCADGITEGTVRDIALMTRVGRPVCFFVTRFCADATPPYFELSRTRAQRLCKEQYLDTLHLGDVIECRVTHLEPFGAFCDVGCGISALLPIDCLSVSRIARPMDRVQVGDRLHCLVKGRDLQDRLVLTMKELYGTWEENIARFHVGDTVVGLVRSREPYGVFIELTPNLAGLAETDAVCKTGDAVSVYIKNILPHKMKLKLIVLHTLPDYPMTRKLPAAPNFTHLSHWVYSPIDCMRTIETIFEQ